MHLAVGQVWVVHHLEKPGAYWWGWYYVNGQVTQCDARLTFPAREYEVARVSEALLDGASVVR